MSYAVEILVTANLPFYARPAAPARRLPFLHETIEDARTAGADFLALNGRYIASKGSDGSIALFQVVDDDGDIVVAPTRGC